MSGAPTSRTFCFVHDEARAPSSRPRRRARAAPRWPARARSRRCPCRDRPRRATAMPPPCSASIATCATVSVSGRGTNTPGPTASSSDRNGARPVMCCSGSRAARRSTASMTATASSGPTRRHPVTALACTRPRLSPSTWPISSSASTSGDGRLASVSTTDRVRHATRRSCSGARRRSARGGLFVGFDAGLR